MIEFAEAWSGGQGWISRMSPTTRLLCGTLVFISCSAASLESLRDIAIFLGIVLLWTAGCGIPLRRLVQVLRFAIFLFLPLLLLAPIMQMQADLASWSETIHIPLMIGLRGTACIVVCVSTIAVMSLAELGQGLANMRLPHILVALILQIAHQTVLLAVESKRMVAALRVRGVNSAALPLRLRSLCVLPALWMQRLLLRAERVSAAMEVRGFEGPLQQKRTQNLPISEYCAVAVAVTVLGVILVLRWEVE